MKKPKNPLKLRLQILLGLVGGIFLFFAVLLYNTQIVHGSEYQSRSITSNATAEAVTASRGIITDRNGKVLVGNRLTCTLEFSADGFADDDELNEAIWRLASLCRDNGVTWTDTLPISRNVPYTYENIQKATGFSGFLKSKKLEFTEDSSGLPQPELPAGSMIRTLQTLFHVRSDYTDQQIRTIVGVRYELAIHKSADTDYVFADDVSVELISQVADGHYAGVTTGTSSTRVYNTPYAAHILGTVGPIWAEDWNGDPKNGVPGYKDKGYSMNALVGKGGVEEAFESYLHGTNGTRLITTSASGQLTGELYTVAPQPGNTVALTLDLDLQTVTEDSLGRTVDAMTAKDGIARGAAAAVVGVGTGEVLALASYPSYDLSTFNENYAELVQDDRLPMFNRAIQGLYPPGSTFKPCSAVAALESGTITVDTRIQDRGVYTYYSSPQPRCWIYTQSGSTHGNINVTQAITHSCNYFFYEVGRLTGIHTLASYASQFGLGEYTGIEIGGESKGSMATPEYAAAHGLEWSDGQTLTAAIGQSYDLFTPLQLANYIATLVDNGNHYAAHLLKNVKANDNSRLVYVYDAEPMNVVEMSPTTVDAVKSGMKNLTTSTLSSAFQRCVVTAGAKTGTAQVFNATASNGVFVAFAPYDDPQIAVAVVVERGGSGSALANTAVDIINAYFSRDEIGTAIIGENTLLK